MEYHLSKLRNFDGEDSLKQWLAASLTAENWSLEFKSCLREFQSNDDQRNKLRKCIASFANASGGYVIFGIRDNPREICGDDLGDEFPTELDKMLQAVSPRIEPWSCEVEQQIPVSFGHVFVVKVSSSTPYLKPHVVAGTVYIRQNGQSLAIESGEEIRRMIGELDVESCHPLALINIFQTLNNSCSIRSLSYLDFKVLKDIQSCFYRKTQIDSSFAPTENAFNDWYDSISELQEARDEGRSAEIKLSLSTTATENLAKLLKQFRFATGSFK